MSNIVGEGFDKYVVEQVATRQALLGSVVRTNENLVWQNNRNGFVKLVSSADVINLQVTGSDGRIIKEGIFGGGFTQGSQLAEKYVLFNGVTDESPRTGASENYQRAGLDTSRVADNVGAYGLGGSEYGIQPMPGITSANIKTEAKGSLKTATIQIKANNKGQFDIISTLYLRLGYLMLLEWGNNCYYENPNKFISDNKASLADPFLTAKYSYNGFLDKIEEKRKETYGNYDALIGKVVNYNWTFNRDGSYDITIILRSIGDVIESLKSNILLPGVPSAESGSSSPSGSAGFEAVDPNRGYASPDSIIVAFAHAHSVGAKFAEIQYQLFTDRSGTNLDQFKPNGMQTLKGTYGDKSYVDYVAQAYENNRVEYYVRFGAFLDFLQNTTIPNITNGGKIVSFDSTISDNIIAYSPGRQISADPRICNFKYTLNDNYVFPEAEDPFRPVGGNSYMKLMFVYFNFIFILRLLDSLKDKEGKVPLIDLLNGMLQGYCKATGNFNKITTGINTENNKIIFIDETALPDRDSLIINKDTVQFNVYGLRGGGSFVRDMQLKTEITPDLANMITIGSTAAGYVTGQDATMLSNLNKGTRPRISSEITSPDSTAGADENQETETRYKNALTAYSNFIKTISSYQNNTLPKWNEDSFNNFTNTQVQILEYDQKQATETARKTNPYASSPNTGFLPFNLALTMDGLGGMKIYQKYTIDSTFLPENYPDTMEFVITGINNTIQGNTWTTNIDSLAIPKVSKATKKKAILPSLVDPSVANNEPSQDPISHNDIASVSVLRNTIVRIAKSYVGNREIPAEYTQKANGELYNKNDNKGFTDSTFQTKMSSVGWFSSNSSAWCNWFVKLIWKEAYIEVGTSDAAIKSIASTTLNNFDASSGPLTGGVSLTYNNMKALGQVVDFVKGKTKIFPGDLIVYTYSHIGIAGATDNTKRTYESIEGNSSSKDARNGGQVRYIARRNMDTQSIRGIIRVVEPK